MHDCGSIIDMVTLVIGGARSGKSTWAEQQAVQYDQPRIYVATAEPIDEEMVQRIAAHQRRRAGIFSQTIEEPLHLDTAIASAASQASVILIDCVTVWLGNLLYHHGIQQEYDEIPAFLSALRSCEQSVIVVTNEVGEGLVPADPESRHFRDQAGWLNQAIAQIADQVVWMVAGIPVPIKGSITL